MLEYLGLSNGLSGFGDELSFAISEIVDAPWFWPGIGIAAVIVAIAIRR